MGWDFCDAWKTRADVVQGVLRDVRGVIVHEGSGRRLWLAVEDSAGRRIVALALLTRQGGCWGYKLLDEASGIFETDCPKKVLKAVASSAPINEYARSWRAQVAAGASRAEYILTENNYRS